MRWLQKSSDPSQVESLASALPGKDPLVARLLVMRGITDPAEAERFLAPSLSHLHSPYLMGGMKAAVERLEAAIERKEPILIYGDYDVDGTTAIVILKTAIELCGGSADFHVPHRIREGYGMRDEVIERAAANGVRLIISVDTGIRAFAAGDTAERLGIDLIVTDHHLPGQDGVPKAFAVLNPNQPGCGYPCKALCGAGVAFKVAQALMERRLPQCDHARMLHSFMKVVAIATIADAVPLTGENRVFAKLGLDALRSPRNVGLRSLLEVSQLAVSRPLTAAEIAFRIAPRLNAAGRMDVARDVIELFSVKDPERARELANRLDKLNAERQEEERRILDSIATRVEEEPSLREAFCVVIDGEGWHRGVIGITATRVVERYGRPALIISRDGEEAHGSGRSISGFHLLDALESCSSMFSRYGGHAHAVGFALPSANVEGLRSHLDGYARARLTVADFEPSLRYDAELGLDRVTPAFFQALSALEPFGMGNPEPVFVAHGVRLLAPPRMIKDKHVKLRLAANGQAESSGWRKAISFDALGWQLGERAQAAQLLPGDNIDIAFCVDHNEHPEYGGLELSLRDFQPQKAASPAGVAAAALS
ncbi:MAG TPA: single-stranded-DNA-specific exonuclease RecJ [Terriglobales bacterium]|nr:single-stranded-DNA-specific exonuclease RecJ [Terriglobales bacterium]